MYLLKHFDLRLKENFTKIKKDKGNTDVTFRQIDEPEQLRLPESNNSEAKR